MKKLALLLCVLLVAASIVTGCGAENRLDPEKPANIVVWSYYGGELKVAFDELVRDFNATAGREAGVFVEAVSKGNVEALNGQIQNGANNEPGAGELPNLFFAYGDIAFFLAQKDLLASYNQYADEDYFNQFVPGFLSEGKILGDDAIYILPFAKSSEVVVVNKTDFDRFCAESGGGFSIDSFSTWEGILEMADAYRQWVGMSGGEEKALFGIDTPANFIYSTHRQLDLELFSVEDGHGMVHLNTDGFQRVWQTYGIPMINGSFAAYGRYRSDDFKTGDILAYLGSSSSASYIAETIITGSGETYPIQVEILPMPVFREGRPVAIQQGAGLAMLKSTPKEEQASVLFAQWLTETEQNVRFSQRSGYMPVTLEAVYQMQDRLEAQPERSIVERVLMVLLEQVAAGYEMYTPPVFEGAYEARGILGSGLSGIAQENRTHVVDAVSAGTDPEYAYTKYTAESYLQDYLEEAARQMELAGISAE